MYIAWAYYMYLLLGQALSIVQMCFVYCSGAVYVLHSCAICIAETCYVYCTDANVNRPRGNHVTPLHLAAISGEIKIVQKLVENNARINALDNDQSTPLHRATAYDNSEVIEYLVKK